MERFRFITARSLKELTDKLNEVEEYYTVMRIEKNIDGYQCVIDFTVPVQIMYVASTDTSITLSA